MLMMAKQGKWLGGRPPYGYKVISTGDKNSDRRLVPGEQIQVLAVQMMFRLYADKGYTLDQVVAELHARGILNPKGGRIWHKTTVRAILRNRKYVGDMAWNVGHDGKYSEFTGGNVRTSDAKIPQRNNAKEDWIIVADAHEPLIKRDLFERVQERLTYNQIHKSNGQSGGHFALSGLLICGHCGWRMIGSRHGGKPFFKCGLYHHGGKFACMSNFIMESKVLNCVVRKIQEAVLKPENLQKLREEVQRQEEEANRTYPAAAIKLQREIAQLDAKIAQGVERMAIIDRDLLTDFAVAVRGWKEERARTTAELDRLKRPVTAKADLETALKDIEANLFRLREVVNEGDPHLVREMLQQFVSKIELFFDRVERPGKVRSIFRKGVIYIRPQEQRSMCPSSNAANPIPEG
jgi:site-specific DNA recombinase